MDQAKVGKFIAALRREQGLTQEALGKKLGVTNKTVSRWETGTYMPDIELLVPLGETLGVSVNELLAGERLSDERFRRQADENLVAAVRESSFSAKERTEFFKKKWLRDNLWLIAVSVLVGIAVSVKLSFDQLWVLISPFWLVVFCWLRNRMMAYIEGKVYGGPEPPTDG
ncbi:MAG: helix-turn-helix transcriptional regulator [Clostridiales bacterium]|nr:helix-turn-helix transcriptional regulator [Clostridiales bacterium]